MSNKINILLSSLVPIVAVGFYYLYVDDFECLIGPFSECHFKRGVAFQEQNQLKRARNEFNESWRHFNESGSRSLHEYEIVDRLADLAKGNGDLLEAFLLAKYASESLDGQDKATFLALEQKRINNWGAYTEKKTRRKVKLPTAEELEEKKKQFTPERGPYLNAMKMKSSRGKLTEAAKQLVTSWQLFNESREAGRPTSVEEHLIVSQLMECYGQLGMLKGVVHLGWYLVRMENISDEQKEQFKEKTLELLNAKRNGVIGRAKQFFDEGFAKLEKEEYSQAMADFKKAWNAWNETNIFQVEPFVKDKVELYLIIDYLEHCSNHLGNLDDALFYSNFGKQLEGIPDEIRKNFKTKYQINQQALNIKEGVEDFTGQEGQLFDHAFELIEQEQYENAYQQLTNAWLAYNQTKAHGDDDLEPAIDEYLIVDYLQLCSYQLGNYDEAFFYAKYCSEIDGISDEMRQDFEEKMKLNAEQIEMNKKKVVDVKNE